MFKRIKEAELYNNINKQYGMTDQMQRHLANQNAQFIIDLSRQNELRLSYSVPTLALYISNIFFHKKSYINFDRFVVLTACLFIATKIKNIDIRLKSVCHSFFNVITRKTGRTDPFNEQKMKKIKQCVSIYQTQILRTLQYEVESLTPHDYLDKQDSLLFSSQYRQTNRKIAATTKIIILDSYRTRCCLLFSQLVIFVSALLIASRYQGKKPFDSETIRKICKEEVHDDQKLYSIWLNEISKKQKQIICESDVRDCIRILNTILTAK